MPAPVHARQGAGLLVCAWLALTVAACGGDRVPPLPPLPPNAVILAFGDSLTYGTGARAEEAYPAVLARLTGLEVINAGVPGETTAQGLLRLPRVLDESDPDLVLLCLGGNDMLRRMDAAAMEANLEKMLKEIRSRGIPVVLLGVPELGLMRLKAAPAYARLAQHHGVPVEIRVLPLILGDRALKSDSIHPNAPGYRKMAEAVDGLLQKAGAIR